MLGKKPLGIANRFQMTCYKNTAKTQLTFWDEDDGRSHLQVSALLKSSRSLKLKFIPSK